MKWRKPGLAAVILLCCGLLFAPLPAPGAQTSSAEYEVKAAFIFNFAKFVEWPPQAFSGAESPFTICLAGDPFAGALDRLIQGKTLDRRRLTIRRVSAGDDVHACQVLYIAPSKSRRAAELLNSVANAPILTIGESKNFIEDGGIIRLVNAGGHIRFQINPDAADRGSLKISSRLLRVADVVRPRRRAERGR